MSALSCTSRIFDVFGIRPALGRTFLPEESSPASKARVAVLSHGLRLDRFGADPSVVGRGINRSGETWTVIGVLPRQWRFPMAAEIWIPFAPDPASNRGDHRLEGFGRLRPEVGAEQARQDLEAIALRLAAEYPDANKGWGVPLQSFSEWLIGPWVRTVGSGSGGNGHPHVAAGLGQCVGLAAGALSASSSLNPCSCPCWAAPRAWVLPVLVALNSDALPRLDEVCVKGKVLLCALLVSSAQAGAEQARDLGQFVRRQWRAVTPGCFRAVGATLLKGRVFEDSDRPGAGEPPVVVGQELARLLWSAEDPIGKRLQWDKPGGAKMLVVGLVAGIRDVSLQSAPEPMLFLPHSYVSWPNMTLFIKTGSAPESVAGAVRRAIWDVDPNIPVPDLTPLSSRLASATAGPRLNARLLSLFAGFALLVAVMGI